MSYYDRVYLAEPEHNEPDIVGWWDECGPEIVQEFLDGRRATLVDFDRDELLEVIKYVWDADALSLQRTVHGYLSPMRVEMLYQQEMTRSEDDSYETE